ncbi:hypothetical protein FAZ95_07235 [Trinickia violacea]|uniref:JmjC domain-containing protein n=1 Tax=Trinickia violacea TaxID=2571746 RepID=A0A4P8IPP9_9BURK|nr:cupin-like domain-containing protein [Trinickia violacea]QCP48993.1 hypothetical protein FAZ95_07235 [Trinickia violacea]
MNSLSLTEPVLLGGASLSWSAQRRWSWDFFAAMRNEHLELSDAAGNPSLEVRVSHYVQALQKGGNWRMSRLYAAGWRFFEQRPDMLRDFPEPITISQDRLQGIPERIFKPLLWVFIGAEGSGTALHHDVLNTHAWLTVIEGKKRLALHPPTPCDDDYDAQRKSARHVLATRRNRGAWRYLEVAKGDLLFIPATWWHEVVNEGPTIGLTRNFASPDIVGSVAARAREQGHLALLPWLEREMA